MWRAPLILLALVALALVSIGPLTLTQANDERCFAETGHCISGRFRAYWEQHGGLAVFGLPLTTARMEASGAGGERYLTQWFERARFELHEQQERPYDVLLGRLGSDRLLQNGIDWHVLEPEPGARAGCLWFQETSHTICDQQAGLGFRSYWLQHGLQDPGMESFQRSLALIGLPLTAPRLETNTSGDTVLTQWFERARLEWHPGKGGRPGKVLLGRLGDEVRRNQPPHRPQPGFVTIKGDQFVLNGQPILLKGNNYYPSKHPWASMWQEWDGPTIDQEVARARRELGINTLRVLVPATIASKWWVVGLGVSPVMVERLREMVQIAGKHEVKLIVTLFDWYDPDTDPGSKAERDNLSYLNTIVGAFKDDDRILGWDLHNEPDHYTTWQDGRGAAVVGWLARMADAIRAIDKKHLITVGAVYPESYWLPGPDGRTILDISDFISVHGYYLRDIDARISAVRARTSKPVVLEEFGWPSGPECRTLYYDPELELKLAYEEPAQRQVYAEALRIALYHDIAGVVGWWLQDPPLSNRMSFDENGHYGLFRGDGSAKPAAAVFAALRVPPLPSRTSSTRALTSVSLSAPPPERRPLSFSGGLLLRDEFLHFWNFFGGQEVFGRPLSNAYRDASGMVVQYFERARLELNEQSKNLAVDMLSPAGKNARIYLDRVHLTPLGQQAAAGKGFTPVTDPKSPRVLFFEQTGHTLRGAFRTLWEKHGEAFFGPPLSEQVEESVDGRRMRVQYFANWRFEQSGNGPVKLSALGVEAFKQRHCPKE